MNVSDKILKYSDIFKRALNFSDYFFRGRYKEKSAFQNDIIKIYILPEDVFLKK